MIAQFTIENFRSFKEKSTFSLVATSDKELLESNTFEGKKNRFLKSAVIYGANASGKSNFFNALAFFNFFSINSFLQSQMGITHTQTTPFLFSKQTESAPSSFEMIFYIKNQKEETRYRYNFTVDGEKVFEENLCAIYNKREVMLFSRKFQEIACSSYFKEGTKIKPFTRKNCLFLSLCKQFNGTISTEIIEYFSKIDVRSALYEVDTNSPMKKNKKAILSFLKCADLQIVDIKEELQLNTAKIKFGHTVYDQENPIKELIYMDKYDESAGTQRLYLYSERILNALDDGTVLFIDEFDATLHPLIIEHVIKLFNSQETNPKNAQLIISSHAVNIMTNKLFRRDQIWFCEKDMYGATDLYSLVEYKEPPVRSDATFNKNYLRGKYGAVPYLDDFIFRFNSNSNNENE